MGEVPTDIQARVVADVAATSGVSAADVQVVQGEEVVWPDGSLGCPVRGVSYTQASVPGWHVVVAVSGRRYDYRLSKAGEIRLCDQPTPRASP